MVSSYLHREIQSPSKTVGEMSMIQHTHHIYKYMICNLNVALPRWTEGRLWLYWGRKLNDCSSRWLELTQRTENDYCTEPKWDRKDIEPSISKFQLRHWFESRLLNFTEHKIIHTNIQENRGLRSKNPGVGHSLGIVRGQDRKTAEKRGPGSGKMNRGKD